MDRRIPLVLAQFRHRYPELLHAVPRDATLDEALFITQQVTGSRPAETMMALGPMLQRPMAYFEGIHEAVYYLALMDKRTAVWTCAILLGSAIRTTPHTEDAKLAMMGVDHTLKWCRDSSTPAHVYHIAPEMNYNEAVLTPLAAMLSNWCNDRVPMWWEHINEFCSACVSYVRYRTTEFQGENMDREMQEMLNLLLLHRWLHGLPPMAGR